LFIIFLQKVILLGLTHLKYKINSSKLTTSKNSNFSYDVYYTWFCII